MSHIRLGLAASGLLAAGLCLNCGEGPLLDEFQYSVLEAAGDGALGCGLLGVREGKASQIRAISCANNALREGRQFWVVFYSDTRESRKMIALFVGPDGAPTLWTWQVEGERQSRLSPSWIVRQKCETPFVSDREGSEPIGCANE